MVETKAQKDIRQPADSIKDTIKDKADKLCSAMYLVTNFLTDSDQIKWRLRTKALDLKDKTNAGDVLSIEMISSNINELLSLIDIAVLDGRASVMNFSILRDGYLSLQQAFQNYVTGDWYKEAWLPIGSQASLSAKVSHSKEAKLPIGSLASPNRIGSLASNSGRRDKILDFIKQHNWSSIKEIAQFIPNVSSKTVQRELAELVRTGTVKKTGERRWSSYGIA